MPVSGSTLVAAQRTIRLMTFSRAAPTAISRPTQIELVPGRPAPDIEVARGSAAGAPAAPTMVSIAATDARLMIETTLAATSEKLWPSALQHLRRARAARRHEAAEERLDREPAFLGGEIAARGLAALAADRQACRSRRRSGCERREPLVAHQHQELGLRQIVRARPDRSRRGRSRSRTGGRPGRSGRPRAGPGRSFSGLSPFTG